jgi:hypothetical protein
MANTNAPFGLSPVRKLGAACQSIASNAYSIASGYNTAIKKGDPVKLTGTGTNIALADAGDTAVGVFAGCKYVDNQNRMIYTDYWPASAVTFDGTDAECTVYDDPTTVFEIQCDTLAKADIGAHCDWVAGSGSTITQISGAYAAGSATATSGKGLRILRLSERLGNDYGAYAVAEVMFAEHTLLGVTSGAGGV